MSPPPRTRRQWSVDCRTRAQAAQYAARTERLEQRMRVLERIVTDRGIDVADEIEKLRDEPSQLMKESLK